MSEISRDEFDELTARVTALESLGERTWSIIGHLDTSLREMSSRFDRMDDRFDSVDRKLDEIIRRL